MYRKKASKKYRGKYSVILGAPDPESFLLGDDECLIIVPCKVVVVYFKRFFKRADGSWLPNETMMELMRLVARMNRKYDARMGIVVCYDTIKSRTGEPPVTSDEFDAAMDAAASCEVRGKKGMVPLAGYGCSLRSGTKPGFLTSSSIVFHSAMCYDYDLSEHDVEFVGPGLKQLADYFDICGDNPDRSLRFKTIHEWATYHLGDSYDKEHSIVTETL